MYETIVVVDADVQALNLENLKVISFESYLADYPKLHEAKTRIVNLCDTKHYLSRGYYCSLLAEARQHKVLPSVRTINDLRAVDFDVVEGLSTKFSAEIARFQQTEFVVEFKVFFGWTASAEWLRVARKLFDKYPAPVLSVKVARTEQSIQIQVKRVGYVDLLPEERDQFVDRLLHFMGTAWRTQHTEKRLRWNMAILVNPEETHPPSDKEAIKRFVKAASKVGIQADVVQNAHKSRILQYDALFIRETTAIDHHTYRLAREAEKEGLIVLDDPTSILRCCNKVFLHDAFTYNHVPSLKTHIVMGYSPADLDLIESHFTYPLVLKLPEGSFSRGVFKIKDRAALQDKLCELLSETTLILAQEYMYTDFDWRIGVLNDRAIYACRYYMAQNHWQTYNHGSKRHHFGAHDTLPTFEVPKPVLDAALQASKMIGNGLYGVDLKQKDQHAYVIEVNDNTSIDHKVEDAYLGDELYMQIMAEFARRLRGE